MRRTVPMPVAALNRAACSRVEDFVRETLGCGCPSDVFEDVLLESGPAGFPGIPGTRLLAIGGRLLVLLVDGDAAGMTAAQINALLRRGRELRDSGGFNRFRLVITTAERRAATAPQGVVMDDERLHLHFIATARLPELLRVAALQ
ncbi:MAG TPA: hypothetical protein VET88_14825 [Gammaproteobacteria bacterium]|nr:hypothetical protein [Gammaproteobacteria bacterium]